MNNGLFKCECGFTWTEGQSGSHNCTHGLSETIKKLEGELKQATEQIARLERAADQKTTCAGCGKLKPTPLRRDHMGGYVCLTCIDKQLDADQAAIALRDADILRWVTNGSALQNRGLEFGLMLGDHISEAIPKIIAELDRLHINPDAVNGNCVCCGDNTFSRKEIGFVCPTCSIKPPLGVVPRFIWIDRRVEELKEAINRNVMAGSLEPIGEWIEELKQLLKENTK